MAMYAYRFNINNQPEYLFQLSHNYASFIAHNPNDTYYDYAAERYYLRNVFVIDEYERILGLDEIEANFAKMANMQETVRTTSWRRGQKPTSHATKRGYRAHGGVVRAQRSAINICNEWGVKYRKRFTYDSWDDLEYNNSRSKSHYGRHSTGWKDHKYRHQWEHNLPKIA